MKKNQILKLKSTINGTKGLSSRYELAEERISDCEDRSIVMQHKVQREKGMNKN